ncbi:MAG: preprotein translocase subunit SecD, partial [Candidatus Aenigmarchaeota archaeon ex4484_14]
MPTKIKILQMDEISPRLGARFLSSAMIAGLAAIITVSFIVFIRYRKLRLAIPMILVSLSEVLIILGASVLINWTIDLAAIAGIVAAVGTGVDSQIMILDESIMGEKKAWSLKERLKRAFFMIFGAAGTTIGAMLPLLVLGFGMLRGFAITTIVGVLAGVLVTRPAFGRIVEYLLE